MIRVVMPGGYVIVVTKRVDGRVIFIDMLKPYGEVRTESVGSAHLIVLSVQ